MIGDHYKTSLTIMPTMESKCFLRVISYCGIRFLRETELACVSRTVCLGLEFMHTKGIAHHDIKAANWYVLFLNFQFLAL